MDVNDEIDHLARILEKVREIRQICDEAGFAQSGTTGSVLLNIQSVPIDKFRQGEKIRKHKIGGTRYTPERTFQTQDIEEKNRFRIVLFS